MLVLVWSTGFSQQLRAEDQVSVKCGLLSSVTGVDSHFDVCSCLAAAVCLMCQAAKQAKRWKKQGQSDWRGADCKDMHNMPQIIHIVWSSQSCNCSVSLRKI